jgi:hypothetical protein
MAGEELIGLRDLLPSDIQLQKLARSPLMLSVMSLAYRGISTTELIRLSLEGNHVEHLFSTYVERMLARRQSKRYHSEEVKHFLGYLAQQMERESQTVFLIESIQTEWLKTAWLKRVYALILGLLIGLPIATIFNEFITPVFSGILRYLNSSLPAELLPICIIFVFIVSIIFFFDKQIKTSNEFSFSWKASLKGMIQALILIVGVVTIFDLIHWIFTDFSWSYNFYYYYRIHGKLPDEPWWSYFLFRWSSIFSMSKVYNGYEQGSYLVSRLSVLGVIVAGFSNGLKMAKVKLEKAALAPNHGIWNSGTNYLYTFYFVVTLYLFVFADRLYNSVRENLSLYIFEIAILLMGVISIICAKRVYSLKFKSKFHLLSWISLICFLVVHLLNHFFTFPNGFRIDLVRFGLQILVFLGIPAFVLVIEGGNWFKHLILRTMLFGANQIPWNYARFLDYATNLAFLQKVGGGYVFIHRTLLEHFARNFNSQVNIRKLRN